MKNESSENSQYQSGHKRSQARPSRSAADHQPQQRWRPISKGDQGVEGEHDLKHALPTGSHESCNGSSGTPNQEGIDPAHKQQFTVGRAFSDE